MNLTVHSSHMSSIQSRLAYSSSVGKSIYSSSGAGERKPTGGLSIKTDLRFNLLTEETEDLSSSINQGYGYFSTEEMDFVLHEYCGERSDGRGVVKEFIVEDEDNGIEYKF